MNDILKSITEKKAKLDRYRPLPHELVKSLEDWFRVELTYTSNAIEGNTLSRQETALVVEKGITVEGKSLIEHQEAINHSVAYDFIRTLVTKSREELKEEAILNIHKIILTRIDDDNAGRYRAVPVRIAGSTVVMPSAVKVPDLMKVYAKWLVSPNDDHIVKIASDAHYKLVSIHPFVDGNGRTARLLLNLLLMQEGYPPALIRKEDRRKYITSIERGQLGGSLEDYYNVIIEAVERSLDIYLDMLEPKTEQKGNTGILLKIGELAKQSGEQVSTIRYWTIEGLLDVSDHSKGGYKLYDPSMIDHAKKIRSLQSEKRLTIEEIKAEIQKII
ncbi:TPA: Fic family protein [candidate division WWE3 bacterium]|uniref:Fic n=3 Tax=Katanobacteria TaxID=422282 RepID=A0A0G1HGP3_UNCKA|nr:MAG: Fic [candidate division WWE3 bacterium GW2011_GWA2_44_16]OGC51306.1 MAG: cell filamentation protein Fic [candidate division WWE3 bacterium RIFCSPHIGHO2_01_FULL_43_9]HAZ29760.1 Fic family protein [candidate division WWE3 bacterium]